MAERSHAEILAELQRLARDVKAGWEDARYWGGPTIAPARQIDDLKRALDRLAAMEDIKP